MRILFVSDTYYPHLNGVYYFVCRIAPLLQKNGHVVTVIVPSETNRFTRKYVDGIEILGMPSLPVLFYPKVRLPVRFLLGFRMRRLLKEFAPDIIHVQDHFQLSRMAIRLSKKRGSPVMGTNHFMPENLTALVRGNGWKKRLEKFLWGRFSRVYDQLALVTTPTETAAQLIRPRLNVDVVAISSGIDLDTFTPVGDSKGIRERYGIPDKPVLLFVGRLDPEKKLEDVLDAAALALRLTQFCLVIVGKGLRKQELEQRAAMLGIGGDVIFTGFVPESDLPLLYHISRCFIIASIAELLSLATLQAMASGLPVIAARAGALAELVHDTMNGFLFEPGDIYGMTHCITELMDNDALCREMSRMSLGYSREHDIHECVRSFENIYKRVGRPGYWEIVDVKRPWYLISVRND